MRIPHMEPREHHSEKATGGDTSTRSSQAGPSDRPGPVGRIANESRALFDDLREWVELRVQLIQVDVEERIERVANELMSMMVIMVMAMFAAVFLLHGLAVWLGSLLGGAHWGYLIVGVLLASMTWMLRRARPNHFRHMASLYRSGDGEGKSEVPGASKGLEPHPALRLEKEAQPESADDSRGEESGGNDRG